MSNKAERTCPLCMEEMDLTDLHLKPCECGYEICLWCWHHIIEVAEKDGNEGQCPACRNPYNKERTMSMTINSERKISSKKKHKIEKDKPKSPELRTDLENVRVIMRNLVYLAGLPATLASEETVRKKEFLGQYGKIQKVIISRPSESHQHLFPNSCIVYVTFSKEEEALRCIQVVNGYILDGYPLKACFGTTRYCHAWLKNLACNRPNCFYIHSAVSQEDICTKDEVPSVCTSKVQQCSVTALNNFQPSKSNTQRCSGSTLPAPVANHQSPFNCGESHNKTSSALQRASPCGSTITSGKASYASVAVSQGRLNTFSMPNSLVTSSHCAKARAEEETQSNNRIPCFGSQAQPLNGVGEKYKSSKLSSGNCIPVEAFPNFDVNLGNNIEMKDIVGGSSRQASASTICSSTNGAYQHENLERTTRESPIAPTQDSLVSDLHAISIGSTIASTCRKVPLRYSWSDECSDLGLTNLAARSEAKDNSMLFINDKYKSIPDTGATIIDDMWKHMMVEDIISEKINVDSREDSITLDMSSLSPGLADQSINPKSFAELTKDTSRGGYTEVFSISPVNCSESRYPIASRPYSRCSIPSQSANSCTETATEYRKLLSLQKSASSSDSKSVLSPAPRVPPGFHSVYIPDQGESCFRPLNSGTWAQYRSSGNPYLMSSSQKISSKYSYFSSKPVDLMKSAFGGNQLQSSTYLDSPQNGSNLSLSWLDQSCPGTPYQSMEGNLFFDNSLFLMDQSKRNIMQNAILNQPAKNYSASTDTCSLSSSVARESGAIGKTGLYGLTTHIANSGSPIQNSGLNDLKFQMSSISSKFA